MQGKIRMSLVILSLIQGTEFIRKRSNGAKRKHADEQKYPIDNAAGVPAILSLVHLLLDDTVRALLAKKKRQSFISQSGYKQGLNTIFYACKLGDYDCYVVYRGRSRGD
jgi:hypothetical protein